MAQRINIYNLPNSGGSSLKVDIPLEFDSVAYITQAYGGSRSHFGFLHYSLDFVVPGTGVENRVELNNALPFAEAAAVYDGIPEGPADSDDDMTGESIGLGRFGNFVTVRSDEGDGEFTYATMMHLVDDDQHPLGEGATGGFVGLTGERDGYHVHISYSESSRVGAAQTEYADASESTSAPVSFETALGSLFEGVVTEQTYDASSIQNITSSGGTDIEDNIFLVGDAVANLTGNVQGNIISGNSLNNTIAGLGGADAILGGGGNDEIYGEGDNTDTDNDTLSPGDTIFGGRGSDTIYGGSQGDWIHGDSGEYRLWLTQASSFDRSYALLHVSTFDDGFVIGGPVDFRYENPLNAGADAGDDLRGDSGDDTIFGGDGNDTIYGGTGNDIVFGGEDNDILFGEQGDDVLIGGSGTDTAVVAEIDADGNNAFLVQLTGDGGVRLTHQILNGTTVGVGSDGSDVLYDVERVRFGANGEEFTIEQVTAAGYLYKGDIFVEENGRLTLGNLDRGIIVTDLAVLSGSQGDYLFSETDDGVSVQRLTGVGAGETFELVGTRYAQLAGMQVVSFDEILSPVPAPEDDHGDTRNTATLVTDLGGTAVRGEIEVPGDEDFFQFGTQSGRTYGVVATPDNSGVDPEIRVYNSSGQLVASNADLGGGPSAGLSFTSSGGTYYVEISGEGGSTGDYGIGVSLLGDGSGGTAPGDASAPGADIDATTSRRPTHEGDNGDDSWIFSSSSSTEVFIVGNGGDDIVRTGRRDDIVFGGDGDDEIQTRDGDDTIDGGDDKDDIEGGDGNDGILGGRDDDTIDGGDGDDVIAGQHGDDRIDGGDDDDVISGGDGDDRIDGEAGDDGILGDDGDDNLRGGTGNDTIYGGDDEDFIDGEQGRDVLYGDRGRDFIRGGEDADRIDGGDHDDELLGEEGNDSISGGSGDDIIRPGAGDDTVDGDGGSDTLSYESMNGGATIDMTAEIAYGAEIGFDRFDSIDHIIGTNGNDIIIGDGDDNRLNGDSGQDIITGGAGNDEIDGGSSTDTAVFSGNRADYTISASTNPEFDLQIIDNRPGSPDGTDLLDSIAFLQFADVRIRDDDALSSAPTANDDAFEVLNDGPAILDVLANDTDPDGNTLSVSELISQPAFGLSYVVDNRLVFDPNGDFSGSGEQVVSITYRMTDGTGFSDLGTVNLTVQPVIVPDPEGLLINGVAVADPVGYGGGQDQGDVAVSADGTTLTLTDNAWKSITLAQTLTADTVLSFEFNADVLGEVHGIGFDTDGSISPDRTFQLAGTQTWGIQGENGAYDIGDGWQRYDIRVGDYFMGDFDRIVFAMDDDNGTGADSAFRNIEVAEIAPPPLPSPLINGVAVADPVGYGGGQDQGDVAVSAGGTTLTLTDNAWKSIALAQTITADTVLSFEFNADVLGEVHGIGFDTNGSISADQTFQLAGTQTWGIQGENGAYDIGGGWQRYDIRVGDYFTGDFDRIIFAMDDDNGTGADSAFRNIEVAEIAPPPLPSPLINGVAVADPVGYGGSQDQGDVAVSAGGTTLTLTDNAWKSIALAQTITADTVLSFEFNADVLGEVHGIGFDTNGSISADQTFQLAGTQTWGIQGENGAYDIGGGWQRYDIRVGDYFTGDFDRIIFAMDDDNGTGADSAFRNIEVGSTSTDSLAIFDDFEDGILATDDWEYQYSASEFDGTLHLEMTGTDQPSRATIEFEHGLNSMTLSYDAFVHAANAYFYGRNYIALTSAQGEEIGVSFHPQRTSWGPSYENDPDNFDLPKLSMNAPDGENVSVFSTGSNTSTYFDQWVRIEVSFDSEAGRLAVDMESDGIDDLVIQDDLLVGATVDAYTMGTYGWWTGHYTKIDDLEVVGTYIADDFIF